MSSMKILVIETSSEQALLAVVEEGRCVAELPLAGGPELSASLASHVKKLICPPPYDRIVLGIGPGSYTGIRVGAALAQALAFGWNVPLYTACSLAAFATDQTGAVVIDARSGGFYIQIGSALPQLVPPSEAAALLRGIPLIASPHPARLQKRLPGLAALETRPNPLLLIEQATLQAGPLELLYLRTDRKSVV